MKVRIPATTANMGAGFDSFGMALGYYNYISIEEAETQQCIVEGEGAQELSAHKDNLVMRSIRHVYDEVGKKTPDLKLCMQNNIPLSRGMGSSAAAIVGGLYAANALLGFPVSTERILELAVKIEGHPDNVAPALLGGFIISGIASNRKIETVKLLPPDTLKMIVCVPEYKLSTKKSREVLPRSVALKDAVFNVGHASMLVGAFATGKTELLKLALQDRLHQPYRYKLIPGSEQVIKAAIAGGALGCTISGSGPSMIAYAEEKFDVIGRKMCEVFNKNSINAHYIIVSADNSGAQIVQEEK